MQYKHKRNIYLIDPFLEKVQENLKKCVGDVHVTIVGFNTHENFALFTKQWTGFVEYKLLSFFFVNPLSKSDKVWIIFPYTHNRIADPESLHLGLKTMFEQVEPLVKEEIRRL